MYEVNNLIHQNEPFWVPNNSKNYKCIITEQQVIYRELSGRKMMWLQQSENKIVPIVGFLRI